MAGLCYLVDHFSLDRCLDGMFEVLSPPWGRLPSRSSPISPKDRIEDRIEVRTFTNDPAHQLMEKK